ncbi:general stress protein [Lysobacter sp. TY2-98]|uniref:pyridoxamine 5'-phosphate oxidase family protein n=1 Tax=Lysobacter sp. TY2-98 TaxID=2290922 RepID=UPI000E1FFD6E|nr:pyridoxamine 5'-phosphate oxidase family protein [Lysobacter sp. TY2-98]AXK72066.1 general stress protein [Lysobacter sp. TY2-98]
MELRDNARTAAPDRDENIEKLRDLAKGLHVAMLTTQGENGRLFSRPLGVAEVEFDGDLWFATGADSEKVREIEATPQVNVAFASDDNGTYISISGRAIATRDRGDIERHWKPYMAPYFEGGKDDPNLCLIRVEAESAEYWDTPGTVAGKALQFLLTAVTHDPGVLSDNQRINLQ